LPSTRQVITRFYEELWNQWRFDLIPELICDDVNFRGSIGVQLRGRIAFDEYMRTIQSAFPDFYNRIDDLIIERDRAAVRLMYSGTHTGPLFGVKGSGHRIEYSGIAMFEVRDGRVASAWVLADTKLLWEQIGHPPPSLPS
jgi:steroid delta-isomerase-like uncharacterized protein